jgi:hypothetical protein
MSATPRTDEAWAKRHALDAVAPWSLCMAMEIELKDAYERLAASDQKWERRLIAALGGHADSKLWGDDGLIAATWRCVEGYEKMEKELAEAREQRDGAFALIDYAGELLGVPKQEHKSAHGFKILQAIKELCAVKGGEQ